LDDEFGNAFLPFLNFTHCRQYSLVLPLLRSSAQRMFSHNTSFFNMCESRLRFLAFPWKTRHNHTHMAQTSPYNVRAERNLLIPLNDGVLLAMVRPMVTLRS